MAGTQMQLEDWLDDLCVRFIINLPQEDLSSVARICFQVEEAQWFYEDFIRPLDPTLPSMSLRTFCLRIFQHCPLLASFSVENHTKAFEQFLEYKTRVPVRGAIMLNEAMDSTVLVKGWKKGANWSFPRGKINKDEDDLDCAIREVYEETGLDLRAAGLVPTEGKPKYIEISMREQHMRLYVFRDVPMDTKFEPKTRKEISKIQWYKLSELPAFRKKGGQNQDTPAVPNANKFYMVAPFLVPLKKWVVQLKKTEAKRAASGAYSHLHPPKAIDEVVTEDDMWTQTDTGAESSRTPAIDTLAGATQELQRLLKVQAPTQGLQHPPPKDDKGSALLSILQAKGPGPPSISQPGLVHPHTPLDLTLRELTQPHTPHHHIHHHAPTVNTQQPPPSFPFAPSQAAAWNPAMQALQTMPPPHTFPAVPQVHGGNQAQLVHPQPFPPQDQGSTFTRGEFQDWSQNRSLPLLGQYPQQSPDFGSVQPPPQASMSAGNGRSGHLSSQSMALLNAFKGNAPPHGAEENFNQVQPVMPGDRQVPLPPHGPTGLAQIQTGLELTGPSNSQAPPPVSPQELAGSRVGPPGGDHRSALLGMFRKADPKSGAEHTAQQGQTYAPGPNTVMPARGPSIGAVDGKMPQLLDSLSLNQPGGAVAQIQTTHAPQNPVQALAPAGPRPQPNQPIRILQRGQSDIPLGVNRQVSVSPQVSPQELVGQPVPGHFANSTSIPAVPVPGGLSQRPQSGQQQRQQLLSLFGKQKQPSPIGFEIGKGKEVAAEAPRSRMPSIASGTAELASSSSPSHRDSQTPISSADHSFLLGYLESVTNSAAR